MHGLAQMKPGFPANSKCTMEDGDFIEVAVRIRPALTPQVDYERTLWHSGTELAVKLPQRRELMSHEDEVPRIYDFDTVFDASATQAEVFEKTGAKVLDNALAGYNGCLFAYGATASGKTYTLYGHDCSTREWTDEQNSGVVPRFGRALFRRAAEQRRDLWVVASFLEIYNEQLRDLLAADDDEPQVSTPRYRSSPHAHWARVRSHSHDAGRARRSSCLQLLQHPKAGVAVRGLTEVAVATDADLQEIVDMASQRRATGSTCLNVRSSRSHAVLRLRLVQQGGASIASNQYSASQPWNSGTQSTMALVHLVDLAGSERMKKANTSGQRRTEGAHINTSLMVLGQVISALSDRSQRRHAPFRRSRLTHLLQDSLAGNSRTFMVAAVSPAARDAEESLCTLRFADSVQRVRTCAYVNRMTDDARLDVGLAQLMRQHSPPSPPPRLLTRTATPQWPDTAAGSRDSLDSGARSGGRMRLWDSRVRAKSFASSRSGMIIPSSDEEDDAEYDDGATDEHGSDTAKEEGSPPLRREWTLDPAEFARRRADAAMRYGTDTEEDSERLVQLAMMAPPPRVNRARLEQLVLAGIVEPSFVQQVHCASDLAGMAGMLATRAGERCTYEVCAMLPLEEGPVEVGARARRDGQPPDPVCNLEHLRREVEVLQSEVRQSGAPQSETRRGRLRGPVPQAAAERAMIRSARAAAGESARWAATREDSRPSPEDVALVRAEVWREAAALAAAVADSGDHVPAPPCTSSTAPGRKAVDACPFTSDDLQAPEITGGKEPPITEDVDARPVSPHPAKTLQAWFQERLHSAEAELEGSRASSAPRPASAYGSSSIASARMRPTSRNASPRRCSGPSGPAAGVPSGVPPRLGPRRNEALISTRNHISRAVVWSPTRRDVRRRSSTSSIESTRPAGRPSSTSPSRRRAAYYSVPEHRESRRQY